LAKWDSSADDTKSTNASSDSLISPPSTTSVTVISPATGATAGPTGAMYSREVLEQMADLARKH
jgi:aspartate/methionine/tyrosine aminotransferase